MTVEVTATGMDDLVQYFQNAPDIARKAARLALNDVVTRGAANFRREVIRQIAYPAGYLEQSNRLFVSRKASDNSLIAEITASDRPTSLARFAPGQTPISTRGKNIVIRVKRGGSKILRRGFLVTLKNNNVGLAVRLKPGEVLHGSSAARQLDNNLYLLYGPSVDQAFSLLVDAQLSELSDKLASEFLRQFTRLSTNG